MVQKDLILFHEVSFAVATKFEQLAVVFDDAYLHNTNLCEII